VDALKHDLKENPARQLNELSNPPDTDKESSLLDKLQCRDTETRRLDSSIEALCLVQRCLLNSDRKSQCVSQLNTAATNEFVSKPSIDFMKKDLQTEIGQRVRDTATVLGDEMKALHPSIREQIQEMSSILDQNCHIFKDCCLLGSCGKTGFGTKFSLDAAQRKAGMGVCSSEDDTDLGSTRASDESMNLEDVKNVCVNTLPGGLQHSLESLATQIEHQHAHITQTVLDVSACPQSLDIRPDEAMLMSVRAKSSSRTMGSHMQRQVFIPSLTKD